jgi:hypothetical protein
MRRTIEHMGSRPFNSDQVNPNNRPPEGVFRIEAYPDQARHETLAGAPSDPANLYNQLEIINESRPCDPAAQPRPCTSRDGGIDLNNLAFVNNEASPDTPNTQSVSGAGKKAKKSTNFLVLT